MEIQTLLLKMKNYAENGEEFLKKQSEIDLINMIAISNNYYYNRGISLVTDELYDILTDYSKKKYPKKNKNKKEEVGAKVEGGKKVKLPYKMASMNKIKGDTKALDKWKEKYKGPYIITSKLDGISGLYNGKEHKLYTRGDGEEGQDISHILDYIGMGELETDCVFRGELIIKKSKFERKYKEVYSNGRNMVAGLVNKKVNAKDDIIREMWGDIDFVVYELIEPNVAPCVQHDLIEQFPGIKKVRNIELKEITNEKLSEILLKVRNEDEYETDGIVVTNDEQYERGDELKNPDYSFAFKMALTEQKAETTVIDVIWTASKDGYMKPRVKIEAVNIGGVKIEYATGFNAGYIKDNKIGVGAIIEIIRSGDVIPYINKIIKGCEEGKMPKDMEKYKWNETKVDLIVKEEYKEENMEIKEKQIAGFFKKIKVEGLSNGNVRKILNVNKDATIERIIKMEQEEYVKIPGFQEKTGKKISDSIKERIKEEKMENIMAATNLFGRGFSEKRIKDIIEEYPEIIISAESKEEKIKKIIQINGISNKSAIQFVENIERFKNFMREIGEEAKLEEMVKKKEKPNGGKMEEQIYVITGFRDEKLKDYIVENGGKIGNTITKKTSALIVKDKDYKENGKTMEAKKKGIPIIVKEEIYQ